MLCFCMARIRAPWCHHNEISFMLCLHREVSGSVWKQSVPRKYVWVKEGWPVKQSTLMGRLFYHWHFQNCQQLWYKRDFLSRFYHYFKSTYNAYLTTWSQDDKHCLHSSHSIWKGDGSSNSILYILAWSHTPVFLPGIVGNSNCVLILLTGDQHIFEPMPVARRIFLSDWLKPVRIQPNSIHTVSKGNVVLY